MRPGTVVHGLAGGGTGDPKRHPLYARWVNQRQRCRNPRHPRYKDWGGRGIVFAHEFDDFGVYAAHLMALPNALRDGYSVDRINNNRGYVPGNLRWATAAQQRANQYRTPWPFGLLDWQRNEHMGEGEYIERLKHEGAFGPDGEYRMGAA